MSLVSFFLYFVKTIPLVKKIVKVWNWLFGISGGEQFNGPENNSMCSNATTVASNNSTQNSQVYDILTVAHLGYKILQLLLK